MRYLGNKTRLINKIELFIEENNIKGKTFCDLFAGTSSVGDYFKNKYKIISNDFLGYSAILSKGKLLNKDVPSFNKFIKNYEMEPFTYFNKKEYIYESQFLITNNYSPKGKRKFFTEENAIRIDGIRIELEDLYKNKVFADNEYYFLLASLIESATKFSNITGTYEAFLKDWDSRSLKKFKLAPLEMNVTDNIQKNEIYNEDSNALIRNISGDILYIDPPYTVTEYSSAYHVLETIAKYDYPEISGITGRRKDNDAKSCYTRKQLALRSFEDLIRQANFENIIISYSNQSIIPLEELETMLKRYSVDEIVIKKLIPYREYKNIKSSKKGDKLFEVLLYIKKDISFIKSPLNYSGSKDNLMPQIHKYLPGHMTNFVDMMGGAFNVGVNVVASNKVVYNEYNPFIYDIIKTLLTKDKEEIIDFAEARIDEFKLEKGNAENYVLFRKEYNKEQRPLDLFVLSMFCFQNQIRFNSKQKFNTPVGNCAYNETLKYRINNFKPKTNKVEFINNSFLDIDFTKYNKDTLFYFDPPYFITNATYNDGKRGFEGWNANLETELLDYLTKLNENGYKFMLSNVIYHKDKTNHVLLEWIRTNNFKIIELEHCTRKEVLIINYDLDGGIRKCQN